jgi:hypothetical protein
VAHTQIIPEVRKLADSIIIPCGKIIGFTGKHRVFETQGKHQTVFEHPSLCTCQFCHTLGNDPEGLVPQNYEVAPHEKTL